MNDNARSAILEQIPSPVCCQNALAVPQWALSNSKICSSTISTPDLLDDAVGLVGGLLGKTVVDGHTTNSTIREGMAGFCAARKSRPSPATRADGRRRHSSSIRPNFARHNDASYMSTRSTVASYLLNTSMDEKSGIPRLHLVHHSLCSFFIVDVIGPFG